jgi:hypothetical protein
MPLHKNPPKVRKKIAAMGNAALRAAGKIYKLNSETARAAGLKSVEVKKLKRMREETEEQERYQRELDILRNKAR